LSAATPCGRGGVAGASRAPACEAAGELLRRPDELPARRLWLATVARGAEGGTGAHAAIEASARGSSTCAVVRVRAAPVGGGGGGKQVEGNREEMTRVR
jgi:hypothetical protein